MRWVEKAGLHTDTHVRWRRMSRTCGGLKWCGSCRWMRGGRPRDTRTAHGARGQQVGRKAGLGIAHPRRSKGGLTLSVCTPYIAPVLGSYLYSSSAAMAAHTNASASTPRWSLLLRSCHPRVCARDGLPCVHLVPCCAWSWGCGSLSAGRTYMTQWQTSSWV